MTIAKTAREIVEEFAQGDVTLDQLETAILRHMEHHMVQAGEKTRGACAKIADEQADYYRSAGLTHPEDSAMRDRCFARSAVATDIAVKIRTHN